jgi:hypothetical protein
MGRACSTNGAKKNAYTILVEKPEGKRPLGRPTHVWEDIIKMYRGEIEWVGMDYIGALVGSNNFLPYGRTAS